VKNFLHFSSLVRGRSDFSLTLFHACRGGCALLLFLSLQPFPSRISKINFPFSFFHKDHRKQPPRRPLGDEDKTSVSLLFSPVAKYGPRMRSSSRLVPFFLAGGRAGLSSPLLFFSRGPFLVRGDSTPFFVSEAGGREGLPSPYTRGRGKRVFWPGDTERDSSSHFSLSVTAGRSHDKYISFPPFLFTISSLFFPPPSGGESVERDFHIFTARPTPKIVDPVP